MSLSLIFLFLCTFLFRTRPCRCGTISTLFCEEIVDRCNEEDWWQLETESRRKMNKNARERERDVRYKMNYICNNRELGYKVSLYTDWLRAIALLTIYINNLNLVCTKRDNVNTFIRDPHSTLPHNGRIHRKSINRNKCTIQIDTRFFEQIENFVWVSELRKTKGRTGWDWEN